MPTTGSSPTVEWNSLMVVPAEVRAAGWDDIETGPRYVASVAVGDIEPFMVTAAAGLRLRDAATRRFSAALDGPTGEHAIEFRTARITAGPGGTWWLDLAISIAAHGASDVRVRRAFRAAVEAALGDVASRKPIYGENSILTFSLSGGMDGVADADPPTLEP